MEFIQKKSKKLFTLDEALVLNPKTGGIYDPPEDKILTSMIMAVILGKVVASETFVDLSQVRPHSLDFCLNFPPKVVKETSKEIKRGKDLPLLVYWNGRNFIMSDDYPVYLAYKLLEQDEVPVVILGSFPSTLIKKPITTGGKELIPLVQIEQRPDYSSLSDEVKDWMLEQKLKNKKQSEVISNLFVLFVGLNELVSDPNVKEREIHNFILNNPSCFDVYGSRIMSEVWLGKKYRVDLAIQYKLDEKKIQLVELERANIEIFTKEGRFRSCVTHAIQQVEDWLQWWHENPSERPKEFDSSVLPQGIVVIGRSKNISEEDKKRLLHLNNNRQVKVITYDDLLDRIESLIENLETAEERKSNS